MTPIQLIVGLGNPGKEHEGDRHNVGADLVRELARQHHTSLREEAKFFGETAKVTINGKAVHLLIPTTYMNRSGQAVSAICKFFKISPEEIVVAHDELDFPPGEIKIKHDGGHGGHNGLRDIINALGNRKNFSRIRIGIGHPGSANKVSGYVLKAPGSDDRIAIDRCIDRALDILPTLVQGDMEKAMRDLHSN